LKATNDLLINELSYGFAFAKEERKDAWNQLIHDYLFFRRKLKRVFLLIDSRLGIKDSDREFMDKMKE